MHHQDQVNAAIDAIVPRAWDDDDSAAKRSGPGRVPVTTTVAKTADAFTSE